MAFSFRIVETPIDGAALKESLADPAAGACAIFEGWVRNNNDGHDVEGLDYEAHQAIAEAEGAKILEEARAKFGVIQAICEHRVGSLALGDCAVWVGVAAGHRDGAFRACRYIIDETKERLPIWKKEHYTSGTSGWVNSA